MHCSELYYCKSCIIYYCSVWKFTTSPAVQNITELLWNVQLHRQYHILLHWNLQYDSILNIFHYNTVIYTIALLWTSLLHKLYHLQLHKLYHLLLWYCELYYYTSPIIYYCTVLSCTSAPTVSFTTAL